MLLGAIMFLVQGHLDVEMQRLLISIPLAVRLVILYTEPLYQICISAPSLGAAGS
jgi:hypothetical protein